MYISISRLGNFRTVIGLALRHILLILLAFTSLNLYAVEVDNLFLVEIPVADQSPTIRQKAAEQGLREMLVRKSGTEAVLQVFEVQQALPKAMAFLQRFEYRKNESRDLATDLQVKQPFLLNLHFDPVLIDNLLQSAGTSLWGVNRPATLFWLALADEQGRHIISDDIDVFPDVAILRQHARRRGIPILLPLMDFDDRLNIQFSDVWGRFPQPVLAASERYGADAIIAGQITSLGNSWQANVIFLENGRERVFNLQAQTKADIYANLINQVAESLCQQYCVNEVVSELRAPARLVLSGIKGFTAFKHAESALSELSAIRNVRVDAVNKDVVSLSLELLGDLDAVNKALELNKHFEPMDEKAIQQYLRMLTASSQVVRTDEGAENPVEDLSMELAQSDKAGEAHPVGEEQDQSELKAEENSQQDIVEDTQVAKENVPGMAAVDQPATLYYRWVE